MGGELFGFDDEDDGAGVRSEAIGFVRTEHGAHATREIDSARLEV